MTLPRLYDLDTAEGIREIVAALCLGYNYRLYTEADTRNDLLIAYQQIVDIFRALPQGSSFEDWMDALRQEIDDHRGEPLEWWLLGLARKTAQNLEVTRANRLDFLEQVANHLQAASQDTGALSVRDAMMMLWAGAATLTIRG